MDKAMKTREIRVQVKLRKEKVRFSYGQWQNCAPITFIKKMKTGRIEWPYWLALCLLNNDFSKRIEYSLSRSTI